jgi:hypothetical protein
VKCVQALLASSIAAEDHQSMFRQKQLVALQAVQQMGAAHRVGSVD